MTRDDNKNVLGNGAVPSRRHVECRGLRYALPYEERRHTYVRDKYVGRPLDAVLGDMHRRKRQTPAEAASFWRQEIASGRVEFRRRKQSMDDPWEWEKVSPSVVVTKGCSVRITRHVHERVVPATEPSILYEDDKIFAIDKPAGIATVDETGGKGTNSLGTIVREILLERRRRRREERAGDDDDSDSLVSDDKLDPAPAHRLDKPVSGVLFMGKTTGHAGRLLRTISKKSDNGRDGDDVRKLYVARVRRLSGNRTEHALRMFPTSDAVASMVVGGEAPRTLNRSMSHVPVEFPRRVTIVCELGWREKDKRSVAMGAEAASVKAEARRVSQAVDRDDRKAMKRARFWPQQQAESEKTESEAGTKQKVDDTVKGLCAASDGVSNSKRAADGATRTQTDFRLLGDPLPDGTVLVECRPKAGQRHQIRAHLAVLGWPIANDEMYGGSGEVPYGATGINSDGEDCSDGDGKGAFPAIKAAAAYADDEHGTLRTALVSEEILLSWCAKCRWTARTLLLQERERRGGGSSRKEAPTPIPPGLEWVFESDDGNVVDGDVKDDENDGDDVGEGQGHIQVASEIWLHSLRYIVSAKGLDVKAPLPPWASSVEADIAAIFAEDDAVADSSELYAGSAVNQ